MIKKLKCMFLLAGGDLTVFQLDNKYDKFFKPQIYHE